MDNHHREVSQILPDHLEPPINKKHFKWITTSKIVPKPET